MKKIKKYTWLFVMGIFTFILGIAALLTNIQKERDLKVSEATNTAMSLSAIQHEDQNQEQGISTHSVSNADIENYIVGQTAPNQLFYYYDVIVNKTYSWEEEYYKIGHTIDEQGEWCYDPDNTLMTLPESYTFQKGYAYLVDGATLHENAKHGYSQPQLTDYDWESAWTFVNGLYPLYPFDTTKFTHTYSLGCDGVYYYADDSWYIWDNPEICSAIDSNWKSKLNSLYTTTFTKKFLTLGNMYFIVPSEDVTVSLDTTELSSNLGFECYIHKGKILDFIAPEIGGTVNLSVNVDNQPSLEEILSHVKAIDETDGIVPIKVTSSTYVQGEMTVGEFYINLSATDKAGNIGTDKITLNRFDSTSPSIDGQTYYDLNYDHEITLQEVLDNLSTSDNVDTNLPLEVVSDTFTGNEHNLGNYQIVVRTKDLSNNYSPNKTVNLTVKNKGYTIFTAPKEITVTISEPLTLEALKAQIFCYDGYDGEITNYTIDGFDEYTSTSRIVGYNDITCSHVNSGNNETTATVSIKKVDDMVPGIYFDSGYFVMLAPGEVFTITQFKEHAAKVLHVNLSDIISVEGEYDTAEIGIYTLMVCLSDETTEEFTVCVGTEAATQTGSFLDIFDRFFWINSWNVATANLFNASAWNWMNWTFIAIIIIIILAIIGYRYYRKRHPKTKKR